MVALPFAVKLPFILFLIVMTVWSALSWAVSPAQNNLIIQSAKDNPDVLISTNVAISHLGIAAGSYVGGIIINGYSSLFNGWVGSILVLLGLLATVIAVTRPSISTNSIQSK